MTKVQVLRLLRERRFQDGDCVWCGTEPRGAGVLCAGCREKNNARRRKK